MEEKKKGCIIYADLIHTVRKLPKEARADLLMAILEYINGETPIISDILVDLVFEPVRRQIDRDVEKYEDKSRKNSENGKKGGRPRKANESEENPKNPPLFFESEKSHTDTDTDTDKVTKTDTKKDTIVSNTDVSPPAPVRVKREVFRPPTLEEVKAYAAEYMKGSIDAPEEFHNHYEARGWLMNKTPMKNWQAAYRNWIKREKNGTYQQPISGQQFAGQTKPESEFQRWKNLGTDLDKGRRQLAEMLGFPED
jgi:hypothetical protein